MNSSRKALSIAYVLLAAGRPLTTNEIASKAGCDRKTVYNTVDQMELAGFCTEISKGSHREGNKYSVSLRC